MKARVRRVAAVIFIFALMLPSLGCGSGYSEFSETVFDSEMYLSVSYYGKNANSAFKKMRAAVERLSALANRNSSGSAVAVFNALPAGGSTQISAELYDILAGAFGLTEATGGAFDVTLAPLNALWKTDSNGLAAGVPAVLPAADAVAEMQSRTGLYDEHGNYRHFTLDKNGEVYTLTKLTEGFELDVNGYVKGYAADRLADIAVEAGATSAYINVAGEVAAVGDYILNGAATDWGVAVINPDRTEEGYDSYICAFTHTGGFYMATSGNYQRFYDFETDGTGTLRICHIINGMTGLPAGIGRSGDRYMSDADAVTSATVIAGSAAEADALATAVCVLGIEAGAQLLSEYGCKGLIFTADKRMAVVGEIEFMHTDKYGHYRTYEAVAIGSGA